MNKTGRAAGQAKPSPKISTSVSPARLVAFEILQRVEQEGAFASILLASKEEDLKRNDRALCHELVNGVLRRQTWLDRLITHYTNRDAQALDVHVRTVLRLGLYQLRFLTRVPASAAVNESVKLVRIARVRSADALVNAVLRRATREPDYDPAAALIDPVERLAVESSHPRWLIERWIVNFGFAEAQALAKAHNEPAPNAIRVVKNRANTWDLLDRLRASGAELTPSRITAGAWLVDGAANALQQLARDGLIYIQDEASQLVALVVDPQPGERVLDLCAAPGSKTTQIADMALDRANVIAADVHEPRLRTLVQAANLQGLKNIYCVALDGLGTLPFVAGSFDRVIVDAPCSGTGTLRRNPEIRWRISPQDIEELSGRQKQLLLNASKMVRPGGRLIYSTCSVEPEENEAVAAAFLEQHADFEIAQVGVSHSLLTVSGAARTWPHRDGSDGFFIVAFERRGPAKL